MDVYSRIIFSLIHMTGQGGIYEYYKKKNYLKQMSGSPDACKIKKKKKKSGIVVRAKEAHFFRSKHWIHSRATGYHIGWTMAKESKTD